ncbi:energy-coupling factor transport system substrate-specific component [Paraoerskovia marina]|uniref:Energy-coupling factor transport system substrate-specific component n=1 Tax=Paraoerskovia marina TaxID=545619 RepID=A0A1H1SLR6_9CELL|nr:ECF transporter S component [Paraoerskovia marina]SDS48964.1 energy-coupling factor transport system substrate-specific component [Paraoerskovia marina]
MDQDSQSYATEPSTGAGGARLERRSSGLHTTVLLAVLGVVFGFVFWVADQIYGPLHLALGPFGTLAENVLAGAWIVVAPLAVYIVRKPFVAVVAEMLAAAVELVVFASPFGPMILVIGLVQGVGAELAFTLTRYRRYGWGVFVLSGVTAAVVTFAYQCVANGYLGQDYLVLRLGVQIVSCIVLSGLAAKFIGDRLLRTGVLDNYPIGRERRRGAAAAGVTA